MNMEKNKKYAVFDIETNGLLEQVTVIHCLSYAFIEEDEISEIKTLTNYNDIINFLEKGYTLIGHNIIRYDIPVMEKLLNIKINNTNIIDTLGLSWYLYPKRIKHGLESWGEDLGVKKPIIEDWENLKVEDYKNRCEADVSINSLLFLKQWKLLNTLYDGEIEAQKLVNYLYFKLDCAREQEEVGCKIDLDLVNKSLKELHILRSEKEDLLMDAMPLDISYKTINKPSKMYKKGGSLTSLGKRWINLLEERDIDLNSEEPITIISGEKPGNPKSPTQIKDWLFLLGWKPTTFEYRKNKKGEIKAVPQIYVGNEVCPSIKVLYEIEPALEALDMLSLINHRIGVFQSIKDEAINDVVKAKMHGLTNTLRYRHKRPIN